MLEGLKRNTRIDLWPATASWAWLWSVFGIGRTPVNGVSGWPAYSLLALYVAAALIVRAPGYLFSELNWDEGLYRLIAGSLLHGHAPYVEFWDRKPVGIFLAVAGIQAIFGNDILVLRIATSVGVGISAFLLSLLGRRMFPGTPLTGVLAGFFYISYSMLNGGDGTNTELIFTPLYLAGAVILLRTAASEGHKVFVPAFAAGLLAGAALQVKYVVIFDILAFAAIYLIMQLRSFARTECQRVILVALVTGIGIALPTIAVFLWYASIGQIDAFLLSNFVANASLVGETAAPFGEVGLINGLRRYDVLVLGAIAAVAVGPFMADASEHKRSWLALVAWLLAMSLSLLFLRRFANHFFIQTLPALSMAAAWFVMQLSQAITLGRTATRILLSAGVILVALWANHAQFDTAIETIAKRGAGGVAHWGDRTGTIAAALRGRLNPSDEIYVFGRTLGVYGATDRQPPTRFPFTMHLWEPYAPLDGAKELQRIVDRRPSFIIIDDLWLPDRLAPDAARDRIASILHAAIAQDYVLDGKVTKFMSSGGGYVGGGIGATVFRRPGIVPFQSTPTLQYTPSPYSP